MNKGTHKSQHPVVPSLLRWFCPDHLIEEIEGDLLHKYERDVKTVGEATARRKLLWNTIRVFQTGNYFEKPINP